MEKLLNEDKLYVPDKIVTQLCKKTYDPQIVQSIIIDIATTSATVKEICKKHGVHDRTLYHWKVASPQLGRSWAAAMEHRALILADKMQEEAAELDVICEDRDEDPRYQGVRSQKFDRKWKHTEWLMSRINRPVFGEKMDIEQTITVKPAEARRDAWQQAVDAEVTVIPPDPTLNKSPDPTPEDNPLNPSQDQ